MYYADMSVTYISVIYSFVAYITVIYSFEAYRSLIYSFVHHWFLTIQ